MSTVEEWINTLEGESKALKQSFLQTATKIPVISKSIAFSPSQNAITVTSSGNNTVQNDPERIIVTFNTTSGANTVAKLEISTDNPNSPIWHRVPYSGGARWTVTAGTKNSSTFVATNYVFTVQSLIDGTISVSEVSS